MTHKIEYSSASGFTATQLYILDFLKYFIFCQNEVGGVITDLSFDLNTGVITFNYSGKADPVTPNSIEGYFEQGSKIRITEDLPTGIFYN